MLDSSDLKHLVALLRLSAEAAKASRRLIRQFLPLLKKVPWRVIGRVMASGLSRGFKALKEQMTPPRPWPITTLTFKFCCTVAAYIIFIVSTLSTVAYFIQLGSAGLSPPKFVLAAVVLTAMGAGNIVQFVQAEQLCILMAKDSRVLWKRKP
jgi:hypothetical protein